jgi:hypothetical protein
MSRPHDQFTQSITGNAALPLTARPPFTLAKRPSAPQEWDCTTSFP